MTSRSFTAVATSLLIVVAGSALATDAADAAGISPRYSNCTELNKAYKHGVSDKHKSAHWWTKNGATARGAYQPSLYRSVASSMDRDKDHIACEK